MNVDPEGLITENGDFADVARAPCAAYVVKNDSDLTLLMGNQAFYTLFGCSKEDMRYKYGNRLGAFFDVDSLKALDNLIKCGADVRGRTLCLNLRIMRNGKDAWIHTQMVFQETDGDLLFHCVSFDITEQELERQRLREYEESVRIAVEQAAMDCFEYDLETGTARMLFSSGILPANLCGPGGECPNFVERVLEADFISDAYKRVFHEAFLGFRKGNGSVVCELRLSGKRETCLWVRFSLVLKRSGPGSGCYVVGTLENITQEKEAARSYLNETQFYQAILSEKDAYAEVDVTEDTILRIGGMWNIYNEIIDRVSYSDLIVEFINKVVHPDDRKHYLEIMRRENFVESLDNGIDRLGCDFRRIVEQNKMMWMQLGVHLFRDPLTRHVFALLSIKNIDEKKKRELSLLRDSRLDLITNMYNRKRAESLILEQLEQHLPDELCAFIILDIDDFKLVNDSHGHKAGDQVLIRLSDLLSRSFRKNDIIGRFGGDEFILYLGRIGSRERVEERMEALYTLLRCEEDGPILCSAGIALGQGKISYEELFQQADCALYQAKRAGKNCFLFYADIGGTEALLWTGNKGSDALAPCTACAVERCAALPGDASCHSGRDVCHKIVDARRPFSFDAFLGEQGDMAYLVDPATFNLICGNKAFYNRLGLSEEQCTGMKCYEAMHKRDAPCPFCSRANWSTDKFYLWKNQNAALEQEFLIKNKLVSWLGEEVLLAFAVDISNDKNIVDSMGSGVSETQYILSGVQHMAEAGSLAAAMASALETIGCFFRADAVHFWQRGKQGDYACPYRWQRGDEKIRADSGPQEVSKWLGSRKWRESLILENTEAMLCDSYEMYQYMKRVGIRNQRWIQVRENDEELGCIAIDNISGNFRNIAFLESITVFIASEMKKRTLMEGVLHAHLHDDLTGLLSRKSFEDYMAAYHADELACVGVVVMNFNNLKGINSSRGFQTGNYFIKQFATLLSDVFNGNAVFRLNGDEFLIIASEISRTELDNKIIELEKRIAENGAFSVSIGSSWDDVENDLDVLMEQAIQAMKVNKKRYYDAVPNTAGAERRRMLSDLAAALERREFEVFLQPKVELLHGTVIGAEALIRRWDKKHGLIPPAQFIGMLEKNNLIRYIDLFVFEEVCRQLEKWKQRGLFVPIVSLNFSRLTLLERDILASMEAVISRYDISRKYIEIEITESIVASMGKSVLYQAACDLYKAGFAISLDDFGTKYTNLAILAELDFSILKVDKSLVGQLGDKVNHQLIMKNIIEMCRDLGISVLAEGVENKTQEQILQNMKCKLGQGYLYGKPMPIDEFSRKYIEMEQRS